MTYAFLIVLKEAEMKKKIITTTVLFVALSSCLWSQSYKQKLADVFLGNGPAPTETAGYSFTKNYSNSGSHWELDWDETYVFDNLIQYTDPSDSNQSYEMRMGKGGQIYSFKSSGFGEALPPQWRPSFNEAGVGIVDQTYVDGDPVVSNHGNWATWNDEVWMMVGSDQMDDEQVYNNATGTFETKAKPQNIHQAGPYMNNNAHRESDLTDAPFYSPMVHSYYDETNQSFTSISWGQSEDPSYVYNAPEGCDPCFEDPFRPSTLFYQRYKNLGDGVIQVDFLIFNYHRTRGIDYWNVPWAGIRNSSLPYAFISDSATDESQYEALNSLPGYVSNSSEDLPDWSEGTTRRTSGSNSVSSGWFAFSKTLGGNGPSLAFVTAKQTSNPTNAYGDLRWGTAMGPNGIRDLTIFSRRCIGGPPDEVTGLKMWGIVGGKSIRGRYFIVIDSSINAIVNQITSKGLIAASSIEKFTFTEEDAQDIYYTFTNNGSGNFTVTETTQENSVLTIKSKPFEGSFPVYLIATATASRITSDPYYYSLRPYDGSVTSIELLGFSVTALNVDPGTLNVEAIKVGYKMYPNPTGSILFLESSTNSLTGIKMYNMNGQELKVTVDMDSHFKKGQIDLTLFPAGVYSLSINNKVSLIVKK
jgi:hypothetical protein